MTVLADITSVRIQTQVGTLFADLHDGPAGAVPTLLIHGWGGSSGYWRGTAAALATDRTVVVPDMPGNGRSRLVRRAAGIADWVAAAEALLDELGMAQVDVVGHSLGSGAALVLAARRPELVRRLVLTSISLFRSEAERRVFGLAMRVAGLSLAVRARWMADIPGFARLAARRVFAQVPRDPALLRALLLDYLTMDGPSAARCAADAGTRLVLDAAPQVTCPTLLVVSREDRLMPQANVPHTAALIPGCQVHWLGRCGHLPMLERPEEYNRVVAEFLEGPKFKA